MKYVHRPNINNSFQKLRIQREKNVIISAKRRKRVLQLLRIVIPYIYYICKIKKSYFIKSMLLLTKLFKASPFNIPF